MSPLFEWLSWKDARPLLEKVNPSLVATIDPLNPDDSYQLLKVRYPYGEPILKAGMFMLPNEQGQFEPFNATSQPAHFQKAFEHIHTVPMGIVLKRSAEVFLETANHSTPFSIMREGDLVSAWNILSPHHTCDRGNLWNIVSGARSVFMLPKIADAIAHGRLKKTFNLDIDAPKTLAQQWHVFKALSKHAAEPWESEILFFGKKWLEPQPSPEWKLFRAHLLETIWDNTAFLRNQYYHDYVFSCLQMEKGMKPNPYLAHTVKHLLAIASGTYPGFGFADHEALLPLHFIQHVYQNTYQLRYVPNVLEPRHFRRDRLQRYVYYSLQVPTLLEFSPSSRKVASKFENMRNLRYIFNSLLRVISENPYQLNPQDMNIYHLFKDFHYGLFHSEMDPNGEMHPASELAAEDPRIQTELQRFPGLSFCETGPFLKGCIRIACQDS